MFHADKVKDQRRVTQHEHEREYRKALVSIKEKLREVEGPEMRENMQDQIRQWFIECRFLLFLYFSLSVWPFRFRVNFILEMDSFVKFCENLFSRKAKYDLQNKSVKNLSVINFVGK